MVYKLLNWKCEETGETALLQASGLGHIKIISILIDACKNEKEIQNIVNGQRKDGVTALMMAAKYGRLESVKYLVKRKETDIFATDNDGWTALHWASWGSGGTLEIAKEIVESVEGEKEKVKLVKMKTSMGDTAKELAKEKGKVEMARYLSKWEM